MKKRIIAMVIAFVLVFSLFAGLGLYAGNADGVDTIAKAGGASGNYSIVEIVPDYKYAQFAQAAGGTIGVQFVTLETLDEEGNPEIKTVSGKKVIKGVTGTCTVNGSVSTVITYTPDDLNSSNATVMANLRNADLFVINQTAPTSFDSKFDDTVGTGYTSLIANDLDWEPTYEIFKAIAGAYSAPARYIIDSTIYSGNSGTTSTKGFVKAGPSNRTEIAGMQDTFGSPITGQTVYKTNVTKLYMLLEAMDPGTLYGVYFTSHNYDYGLSEKDGNLIGYGARSDGSLGVPEDAGEEFEAWNLSMLEPWFSGASNSNAGFNASMNTAVTASNHKRGFSFTGKLASVYSSISSNLNTALSKSFTLDRKQYRILVVEPNLGGSVNTSLIGDFLTYGKTNNISFVGGVSVTNMSMYQFVGDANNMSESYDIVYFGDTADGAYSSTRASLYGPGKQVSAATNGNTAASKYLTAKYLGLPYNSSELASSGTVSNSKNTKVYWNATSKTKSPSLDITNAKKSELETFLSKGNKIYYSSTLLSKCANGSNIKSLLSSGNSNIKTGSLTVSEIRSNVNSFSVDIAKYPVLYKSAFSFDFQNFSDDVADYLLEDETQRVQRYVNTKKNESGDYVIDNDHRTLDFLFYISGGSASASYTAKLYVDQNNDGRFEENAVQSKEGFHQGLCSWKATPVRDDYSGAVYWKLVIEGDGKKFSKTGVSAYKRSSGTPKTINILQVIPDDSIQDWQSSESSVQVWVPTSDGYTDKGSSKAKAQINATSLLLPTKTEIGTLTNLKNTKLNSSSNILSVERAFNGRMTVSLRVGANVNNYGPDSAGHMTNQQVAGYGYVNSLVKYYEASDSYTSVDGADKNKANKRADSLLANTGLFYYFLSKTSEYDINVKRVSVHEFETEVKNGTITQLTNGKFQYANPAGGGSNVTCDLLMLGMSRGLNPFGSVEYNAGQTTALEMVENYVVTKKLPTYIGGGAIKNDDTDPLTLVLRKAAGQDRYGVVDNVKAGTSNTAETQGFTYDGFAEHYTPTNGRMVRTNTSAITSYPYVVPYLSRCTDIRQQVFQLAVDNSSDITVLYSIWGQSSKAYGDIVNAYYMYKKGNITYCSLGFGDRDRNGQLSSVMKLPEAALIVNSIVSSVNNIPSPDPDDDETPAIPNINILNPDKDEYSKEIPVKNTDDTPNLEAVPIIEKDDTTKQPTDPDVPRAGYTKKTDYFYPDFDFDNAKASESGAAPTIDLSQNDPEKSYIYNNGTNPVLKIKFSVDPTTGSDLDAHMVVKAGNKTLDIPVKYIDGSGTVHTVSDNSINVSGVTEYFIEVPLNQSYYAGQSVPNATNYGIDTNENFGLTIEVIPDDYKYGAKTDINVVKRGLFTIH